MWCMGQSNHTTNTPVAHTTHMPQSPTNRRRHSHQYRCTNRKRSTPRMGPHGSANRIPKGELMYECDECHYVHTTQAAQERCDCGQEDHYYSPSRNRVSYITGED